MTSVLFGLFLFALACVESGADGSAISPNYRDVGILQISEVMVDECNRIVGEERWNYEDRLDIIQSYEMAGTFYDHYRHKNWSVYDMSRVWNQGVKGYQDRPDDTAAHDHSTRVVNLYKDLQKKRGM